MAVARIISILKRRNFEVRRAESGGGVLGEGLHLPRQLGGLGERCKLPSGVRGGAPAAKRFPRVFIVQSGLYRQFSVVYFSW